MLPWVMRAGYRKLLVPNNDQAKQLPFFKGDPIDLNKLTDLQQIEKVHQLLRNDDAKIEYLVENRAKKKKRKSICVSVRFN